MVEVIEQLVADPSKFLKKHAIIAYNYPPSNKYNVEVVAHNEDAIDGVQHGTRGDSTYIKFVSGGKYINTGDVAWLKYEDNRTTTLDLYFATSARVVLTDQLTGCSFGVMKWKTGGIRVAHANLKSGGSIDAGKNDRTLAGYRSFHKRNYIKGSNEMLGRVSRSNDVFYARSIRPIRTPGRVFISGGASPLMWR
ncbi:hypothetical protein [Azospirillum doebereinerae]